MLTELFIKRFNLIMKQCYHFVESVEKKQIVKAQGSQRQKTEE